MIEQPFQDERIGGGSCCSKRGPEWPLEWRAHKSGGLGSGTETREARPYEDKSQKTKTNKNNSQKCQKLLQPQWLSWDELYTLIQLFRRKTKTTKTKL